MILDPIVTALDLSYVRVAEERDRFLIAGEVIGVGEDETFLQSLNSDMIVL